MRDYSFDSLNLLAEAPTIVFASDSEVMSRIERLKRITGFATAYDENDQCFRVFARFDHVQRVAWIARQFAELIGAPVDETLKYVWLHDINRWAFSHNSEIGNYSQSEDISRYFEELPEDVAHYSSDLKSFHEKKLPGPNASYDVALAADMLAGMLEDPLMLIGGLNVSPDFLEGTEGFGVDHYCDPERIVALKELAKFLHLNGDVERFRHLFAEQFTDAFRSFTELYNVSSFESTDYYRLIAEKTEAFKQSVLRPRIFPVNNELVSNASAIKEIVKDLKQTLGEVKVRDLMLEVDDQSAPERFLAEGIDQLRVDAIKPKIDGIATALGVDPLV
ncbi:hypothetical protein CR969_02425 [Candidatus Saccharibacteria bacterium]|nr:MAG: hypothetical protein CR969_02425 [Candidatus Saccharibacteria bacterium]